MPDVSRRKFLSLTAAAPLAATVLAKSAAAKEWPVVTEQSARQRLQQLHLPNLPLISHEGKRVLFYDDLVKGKVVSLNFFFANCDEVCPLVTANLAKVQKLLGDQVGRDIHMYSFTLKPEEDNVEVIRNYRAKFGAGPGWTFFTAKPTDMEKLRVAIGFTYPNPVIDKDTTQHIGNVRYGNEPRMLYHRNLPYFTQKHADWLACQPPFGTPRLAMRGSQDDRFKVLYLPCCKTVLGAEKDLSDITEAVRRLQGLNCFVTVYPLEIEETDSSREIPNLPSDVEVLPGGRLASLPDFLASSLRSAS